MTTPTKSLEELAESTTNKLCKVIGDYQQFGKLRKIVKQSLTKARAEERERFEAQEKLLEECEQTIRWLLSQFDDDTSSHIGNLLTKLQERKK